MNDNSDEPTPERIEAIGDQLRAKISSKFTTSTFLAGFAFTFLASQVMSVWQQDELSSTTPLAIAFSTAAVLTFVAAAVTLDSLTMPKRFWPENKALSGTRRYAREGWLTTEDLWTLYALMVYFWYLFTIVAAVLTAIAVAALLAPAKPAKAEIVRADSVNAVIWAVVFVVLYWSVVEFIANRKWGTKRKRPKD